VSWVRCAAEVSCRVRVRVRLLVLGRGDVEVRLEVRRGGCGGHKQGGSRRTQRVWPSRTAATCGVLWKVSAAVAYRQ
jgi:hypothetical protein